MASSVTVQKRVENERSLRTFGRSRRRVSPVARIEHARLARLFGRGICLHGSGRLLRRRRRGQIERSLASAAAERKHGNPQNNKGPSLTFQAAVTIHVKSPMRRHLTKIGLFWRAPQRAEISCESHRSA